MHTELGLSANPQIGNTTFPQIVADLAGADNSIKTAIQFTGGIRNTFGLDCEFE